MHWKVREAERLLSGEYKRVPWHDEPWYLAARQGGGVAEFHFLHVSKHDPKLVAYTASPEHGEQDRQTRTKPGRYLLKYFGDVLSAKDIQFWCSRFTAANTEREVEFATTADEIQWVYENGPHSCMAHFARTFDSVCHPVRVYAAGDLAVAFIRSPDGDGVTARAVCWPAQKMFTRVYGDVVLLADKLEDLGYRPGCLEGARLLRIEDGDDQFVCPYLDSVGTVQDCGDFLRIGGDIPADRTDGLTEPEHASSACDRCGERHHEDSLRYIDAVESVWCDYCVSQHTTCCGDCGTRVRDADVTPADHGRFGTSYDICADCLEHYSVCTECGDVCHTNYIAYHERSERNLCDGCRPTPEQDAEAEEAEIEEARAAGAPYGPLHHPNQPALPMVYWS